jgi:hypothetical protein
MSRRGDESSSLLKLHPPEDRGARDLAQSQLPAQFRDSSPTSKFSVDRGSNFTPNSSNFNHSTDSFFAKVMECAHRIASIPSFLIGSILQTYDRLTHGVVFIFNTPSRLGSLMMALFCSVSAWVSNKFWFLFLSCRTVSGTHQTTIVHAKETSNFITHYWCHLLNIVAGCFRRMRGNDGDSSDGASHVF